MSYFNPDRVRQGFFILIILLLAVVLFKEMSPFLPAFLGAFTFFVLLRKGVDKLVDRGWKRKWAAGLLMLLSFLVILLPFFTVINMLSGKISFLVHHSGEIMDSLLKFLSKMESQIGADIANQDSLKEVATLTAKELPSILGATFNTLTTLALMYFILFFLLVEGDAVEKSLYQFLPVAKKNVKELQEEINSMVFSNAIGIPLIAVLQGVVGLIGYLVLGVKEPMLWFVITCFTAMLPLVGAALAYVPLAIVFFANDETTKGIILLIYGFGVIGSVDNIFRFWLQKKIGDVHPLITIFGVLIGLKLFGFIGLVFGPLLISIFFLLLKFYRLEYAGAAQPEPDSSSASGNTADLGSVEQSIANSQTPNNQPG
jgi:predicted PurR-regulated permease PerM